MQHPNTRHLALVDDRPERERDLSEAQQAALGFQTDALPFAVRLTLGQILQVAEDADIRAEVLYDVASAADAGRKATFIRRVARGQIDRRVDGLHAIADDLRDIAAQTIDRWMKAERPS